MTKREKAITDLEKIMNRVSDEGDYATLWHDLCDLKFDLSDIDLETKAGSPTNH